MDQDNKHAEYVENYKLNPKSAGKMRALEVTTEVKIRGWDRREQHKEQQQKEQDTTVNPANQ